jgi:hypothetical protein
MSTERRKVRQTIQAMTGWGDSTEVEKTKLDSAADTIISIFNETRPLQGAWALATGGRILRTDADELAAKIRDVSERLENELRFNNIGAHKDFNGVAKKIIEAEGKGQGLGQWISWAKRDERSRAYLFTYARNPLLIWQDWRQAFPETTAKLEADGGMYV